LKLRHLALVGWKLWFAPVRGRGLKLLAVDVELTVTLVRPRTGARIETELPRSGSAGIRRFAPVRGRGLKLTEGSR